MEPFEQGGLYSFQKELKRNEQSIAKRLASIEKDSKFLTTIKSKYESCCRLFVS
jgi:hypothetical protein